MINKKYLIIFKDNIEEYKAKAFIEEFEKSKNKYIKSNLNLEIFEINKKGDMKRI